MDGDYLRFGEVEFDRACNRLQVAGRPVSLDRFSLAVFGVLIANAGREVSKDALLDAGWSGRVVNENSLAKAIGRLRNALGEDGAAIETVHGYGYRFSAEVASPVPGKAAPAPRLRRSRPAALAALTAVVLVLAAGTVVASRDVEAPVVNGEPADARGRVLWVDDHQQNNGTERRFLSAHKIAVYQATSTADALTLLPMYEYAALISDMGRGDQPLAGVQMLRAMRERGDRRPFVLYTVHASPELRKLVADAGGQGVAESRKELYAEILPLFGLAPPGPDGG